MRKFHLSAAAVVLALTAFGSRAADKTDAKPLDEMIDKAMKGYNDAEPKVFYADFAKSMAGIATEQAFKTLYVDKYKKDFGDYVSRKVIEKETVLIGDFPLMQFEAEMSKEKKVKLSVNFTKEDGKFKIMQIQFNKM